jgi:glycosyltransferase involved in cell wall biosynthesis
VSRQIPVTAIVMAKNEERNLAKCLRSVSRFSQVVVVDSNSTDATRSIAESLGADVLLFSWNGRYPKKKQWCLENVPFHHSWVIYVDADEELMAELVNEIELLLSDGPQHAGYFVGLDYHFHGQILRHGHRVYKLVMFDRTRGRFEDYDDLDATNMWEVEGHYQPQIDGTTGILRGRIVHDDHDSLFHYFERHNRYSDWEAVLRNKGCLPREGEPQPGARGMLKRVFARMPCKGVSAGIYSYFFRLGFLDGRAGLQFAISRGFYYWQVGLKQEELRRNGEHAEAKP